MRQNRKSFSRRLSSLLRRRAFAEGGKIATIYAAGTRAPGQFILKWRRSLKMGDAVRHQAAPL
jgi:hypothetical protein